METLHPAPRRRWRWLMFVPLSVIVLAIAGVLAVARNVHVHEGDSKDFAIDLPGGQFRLRAGDNVDPATLGVPRYPGARRSSDSGSVAFSWSSSDGAQRKDLAVAGVDYITRDSIDKVVAFYREQLPNWMIVTEDDGKMRLELRDGGVTRIVAIQPKNGDTHIGIATIGRPESN